jgi:hypothetical protein
MYMMNFFFKVFACVLELVHSNIITNVYNFHIKLHCLGTSQGQVSVV